MSASKPLVVTMGDAVGIGPECIVRSFHEGRGAPGAAMANAMANEMANAAVIGDVAVMRRAAAVVHPEGCLRPMIASIDRLSDLADVPPGCVPVLQPPDLPAGLADLPWGRVDARAGVAAARCIEAAVRLVQEGEASAIVTAPIHKAALAAAGIGFPGHTEMLQALSVPPGQPLPPVRMMLANDELRVVLVTIHMALRQAIDAVTYEAVLQTLRIAHAAARRWGLAAPRLGVAGLNPHAGEDGLFGDEEVRVIAPAVAAARAEGIDASGPFAPDTVFMRARNAPGHPGEFDLVVAMTHDHGLIPVKYLGVEQGVNVTLGLPFVRTSPDHGTAFDIAGRGVADASSLLAALQAARRLSEMRPSSA